MVTQRFLCRPVAVLLLINTGNDESGGIPRTKTKNDTFLHTLPSCKSFSIQLLAFSFFTLCSQKQLHIYISW
jgi:hypothetical protein